MYSITWITRARTLATITTPSIEAARMARGALVRSAYSVRVWHNGELRQIL
jgi:hypothetical protein